jgi:hypothetical protein
VLGKRLMRIAALPVGAKTPLLLVTLVVLALSVLLSPLVIILAILVLVVADPEGKRHA